MHQAKETSGGLSGKRSAAGLGRRSVTASGTSARCVQSVLPMRVGARSAGGSQRPRARVPVPIGVCYLDRQGRIIRADNACCALLGTTRGQLLGMHLPMLRETCSEVTGVLEAAARQADGVSLRVVVRRRKGKAGRADTDLLVAVQAPQVVTGVAADWTMIDPLTGLGNRVFFCTHCAAALADLGQGRLAVLLLDLTRFREVNETLGHTQGDEVLRRVSMTLQELVPEGDVLARLGGDEFGVVVAGADAGAVVALANRILGRLAEPCQVDGCVLELRGSIGIALAPGHGSEVQALFQSAERALRVAKCTPGRVEIYAAAGAAKQHTGLRLLGDLRHAAKAGQLLLQYQPIVLAGGGVWGIEALLRWQHPVHGLLGPERFIGLAEENGVITQLTMWVLEEAIRQCRRWHSAGRMFSVAVNPSMETLHEELLPDLVYGLLRAHDLAPNWLTLEITETAVMAHPERVRAVLARLAGTGVRLAIDDFGVGHSSLAYLRRLPVHALKIDQSFVGAAGPDRQTAAVISAVTSLGHSLALEVVAEGIESALVWEALAVLGCDAGQGFHLCRPLAVAQLDRWLAEHGALRLTS